MTIYRRVIFVRKMTFLDAFESKIDFVVVENKNHFIVFSVACGADRHCSRKFLKFQPSQIESTMSIRFPSFFGRCNFIQK